MKTWYRIRYTFWWLVRWHFRCSPAWAWYMSGAYDWDDVKDITPKEAVDCELIYWTED